MARTQLTPVSKTSKQGVTVVANAADITFVAGDVTNGNYWTPSGNDTLLVYNSGVSAATITIDAAPDSYGRDGAITTYSVGAGETAWFGPFDLDGWKQTDDTIHVDVSSTDLGLVVFQL